MILVQCDVLHGDLKIDNFILQNDKIFLCDFGKAIDNRLFISDESQ